MSERMTFTLDGRDNLTRVLDQAGDSAGRLHRRIEDATTGSGAAVQAFTRDAGGRLRDLRGRFLSAEESARALASGLQPLPSGLGAVASSGSEAGAALGKSGGGLGGSMSAVAGIAVLSLLPALGALVPMAVGLGAAMGTLKLGFAGVGEAAALASGDKKKYQEALKKLSPEARTFTKELVGLKKEFGGVGKDIQKAMLPGFTAAVRESGPVVKILGRSMTEMGKGFGDAARGVGRLMKDSGFQKDFAGTLQLGNVFVRDLTTSMGPFVKSLLAFGAASGPTLKAFSGGISDLLGKGLPGMFEGLETGIAGSAKFLDGFFGAINRILPAVGRFSGEVARTFGPLLGETLGVGGRTAAGALDTLGSAVKGLSPVFKDVAFGVKSVGQLLAVIGPAAQDTAAAIIGALLPSFSQVDGAVGPLQRLSLTIQENKGAIQEMARVGCSAIIDLVSAGVEYLPTLIKGFRMTSEGILTALGGILHGSAAAFGWIPGIGDKLKSADRSFGQFKDSFLRGLTSAEEKTRTFSEAALPRLQKNKLLMNISNWEAQIKTAKDKLSDKNLPPSKKARLLAEISDLQAKVRQAKGAIASVEGKSVSINVTTYVKQVGLAPVSRGVMKEARGGVLDFYASGGMREKHTAQIARAGAWRVWAEPETGGESYIPLAPSKRPRSRAIAEETVDRLGGDPSGIEWFASGGTRGRRSLWRSNVRAISKDTGRSMLLKLTASASQINAMAKELIGDIERAFKGRKTKVDDHLITMITKNNKKLRGLAADRDKIAAKIQAAKQFSSSVRSEAKSSASLSSLGQESLTAGGGGIKAGLQKKLSQIKMFGRYISTLAKRGLNKGLLRQILEMGPEEGFAYASTLAGSSKSTLKDINSVQASIDKESTKLGKSGADILYDSGKNAGKGFLTGLKGQQKNIEDLMLKIAKGMQKAIREALGIKSPSRVMAKLGGHATEGLAEGMLARMPVLDDALGRVSGAVAGTRPGFARPVALAAAAASGHGVTNIYNITVEGAMDPGAVARQIEKLLAKYQRNNGGMKLVVKTA